MFKSYIVYAVSTAERSSPDRCFRSSLDLNSSSVIGFPPKVSIISLNLSKTSLFLYKGQKVFILTFIYCRIIIFWVFLF
nr:MAG TPA: hypothetical protein [Crassvirales sp.]